MVVGGALLRIAQTGIRAVQLLASIAVLGIFSYYLVVLKDHHLTIQTWIRAVEGMSGAAVLYTGFAVILTVCFGGIRFFAFLAILLDICFIGCFTAIAILTRGGAGSCTGNVNTPLGDGPSDSSNSGNGDSVTYLPNLHQACVLEKAAFGVSIFNAVLFLLSAFMQYLLAKHHRTEKRYGPSPANNYTAGPGRRPFWRRKNRHGARDAEFAAVGAGALAAEKHHNNHMRPSDDTAYTGTTMDAPYDAYGHPKYTTDPVAAYPERTVPTTAANF